MLLTQTPSWHPASWQDRPALQQPDYPDAALLAEVVRQLAVLPPLVTPWEVRRLQGYLAEAAAGRRFLLQGGECAERFADCTADVIANRLKILLQMSVVLIYGLRKPVVRVGRFAGQYAKPRSEALERRRGQALPSYRGDLINGAGFTAAERTPDPRRMREAYSRSALTLNYVRGLAEGGFADLRHADMWNLDFVQHSPLAAEYQAIVRAIDDALRFMETIAPAPVDALERVEFFTSHEALLLPYEQALTRTEGGAAFNLSTHFPWVGMRTAQPDGAHIEYLRGLANPVAVKVGPDMTRSHLTDLLHTLHPNDTPGHLTLITRFGVRHIERCLPPLIEAVQATGKTVLWCCDPMHGNTETLDSGLKTRRFENILSELDLAFDLHAAMGSHLGGVHFELTGEDVTECTGGARGLGEADLERAYKSQVDPRLNGEQALEMAFCIVRKRHRL
jgi:3-deoxy-7-phosphoheptulonate synthase